MAKEIKIFFIAVIIAIILSGIVNASHENKTDKDNRTRVIIQFKDENEDVKGNLIKSLGKDKVRHIFKKEISADVSEEELVKLRENPYISSVKISKKIFAFLQDSIPLINASVVWPIQVSGLNITGINETICIIDTGINFTHPDLVGKNKTCIIDCISPASGCVENCSVFDDNGHGTHVAGIVAASGSIKGVAIGANLIGVKVLNSAGGGNEDDLNAGIQWCTDNSETYNISVISMSLGDCTNHSTYCNGETSASYVNAAVLKNISVIAAAGNGPTGSCASSGINNTNGPSSPACIENVTAIGAVSKADSINFQRGVLFEIMAPGVSINSTFRGGSCLSGCSCTGNYMVCSGTSMATPHAAGAIALIRQFFRLEKRRVPSIFEIRNVINSTGKQINDSGGTGRNYPRIDVYSAILSLDNTQPNVTLISPLNNSINSSVNQTFSCNATDLQLVNITLYLWNSSSGLVYNETKNISGTFNSSVFNATNLSYDSYKWNCLAYDARNNSGFAVSNFSIIVRVLSAELNSPVNNSNTNQNHSFNCSFRTEESKSLKNATFYLWNSSMDIVYNLTQNISGISNFSIFIYNFSSDGNYSWNCKIFNNNSESAFANSNFTVNYETTPVNISSLSVSVTSSSATITWNSNENSNSSVNYGTGILLGSNQGNSSLVFNHSILLQVLSSSTIYYYNITSCDIFGNCITNGTYNFTTSAEPSVISTSSGGGGGGSIASYNTYNISFQQALVGYTKELSKSDRIIFTFFDGKFQEHSLIINEIKTDSVNITIKSNTINLVLGIGQSARLNLSSPNYYDLYIKLESIENSRAKLTLQLINELIPKYEIPKERIEENKTAEEKIEKPQIETESIIKEIKKLKIMIYFILIIFIITVFIVLFAGWIIKKKSEKKGKIKEYKEVFNKHIKPDYRRIRK